jgi:SAM-dependent methyltransferase
VQSVVASVGSVADRKRLGQWYTPEWLVDAVVDAVVTPEFVAARSAAGRALRVLDPACGDGRFLAAVTRRVASSGGQVEVLGIDVDSGAVDRCRRLVPEAHVQRADALTHEFGRDRFDLVIGNPPFLSQLSRHTSRGGASSRGGGPYADAAAEFLALGADLVDPDGGRLALVLPQSLLASRDAGPIRRGIDARATMCWSWWTGERAFDADVSTCVVAFEFGRPGDPAAWSEVVTSRLGVPPLPPIVSSGRLGDRARLNANFRDEYYGLVGAVGDHATGPPLVTSGLIDPGRSWWGARPVTFARRRWERPRVDVARLDPAMRDWARKRLVPKVLVANQTAVVEAVCDADGEWLPGVPVVAVYPSGTHWDDGHVVDGAAAAAAAWEIAAVLTSSIASAWVWHRSAGTGLGAASVRMSPAVLADLPWPGGELDDAVVALRHGDLAACSRSVAAAYGPSGDTELERWWSEHVERIGRRSPSGSGQRGPARQQSPP